MTKFWYVSRDPATVGYHDPKKAYFDKDEAKKFAESMCRKTGHDFYVMEAVELVKQSKPPVEWHTLLQPLVKRRDEYGRFIKSDIDYTDWLNPVDEEPDDEGYR